MTDTLIINTEIIQKLAELEHKRWSDWMEYLFSMSVQRRDGSVTIPRGLVDKWQKQIQTAYNDLPIHEQNSDIIEVDKSLRIIQDGWSRRSVRVESDE